MIATLLLSAVIFLPAAGGVAALPFHRRPEWCRWICVAAMAMDLFLALNLYFLDFSAMGADVPWIGMFGIHYALALDGINLPLVTLTAFLGLLCVMVSWRSIRRGVAAFHLCLMLSVSGVIGLFLATDLFLFYLFWELQAIPLFFLIGMWGHEGRARAAVKFFLFSFTGSLLMLVALIGLYMIHGKQTGNFSFSFFLLRDTLLTHSTERWLYAAFLLAFAVKIPLFPVHTWLPDAHTEAPTAGSVILAGLLLKTGMFALLRFAFPLFPEAARASVPILLSAALVGMFYAAWIAFSQQDMKRLVAYSSISHMGLMVVGVALWNTLTLSGAVLQMINHGLVTSALFIMVGMIDERIGSRRMAAAGGLWGKAPVLSGFFLLFAMASMGLPGLNNFVGETLILVGAYQRMPAVAVIGFAGLVFTLIYTLRLTREVIFGPPADDAPVADLDFRETAVLASLAVLVILIGLAPGPLLRLFQGPVGDLMAAPMTLVAKSAAATAGLPGF